MLHFIVLSAFIVGVWNHPAMALRYTCMYECGPHIHVKASFWLSILRKGDFLSIPSGLSCLPPLLCSRVHFFVTLTLKMQPWGLWHYAGVFYSAAPLCRPQNVPVLSHSQSSINMEAQGHQGWQILEQKQVLGSFTASIFAASICTT